MQYRIGNLIPSTNLKVEPILARASFNDRFRLDMLYGRNRVQTITADGTSAGQFTSDSLLQSSQLLIDAEPDAIVWYGTSATYGSLEQDQEFVRNLFDTHGVWATTTTLAMLDYVHEHDVRSLFLLSPFTPDITARIRRFFLEHTAVDNVQELSMGIDQSMHIAQVPDKGWADQLRQHASDFEGLILSPCTNVDMTAVKRYLRRQVAAPIVDVTEMTYESVARKFCDPLSGGGSCLDEKERT